jgi:tetratricopeptide (TPR) repeat protein
LAQKQSTRRQLVEDARQAAQIGNWEDAVNLNQQIIDRFQTDAEAFNRLGRAYVALGNVDEARDAYAKALKADPANLIARRNLQRLEILRGQANNGGEAAQRPGAMPRTSVFLEEVGKTWVDELVNPGDLQELADIYSGEQLTLSAEDEHLVVRRESGVRLGDVEPKTAHRVIDLIGGGNRYEIYALGLSNQTLRYILREIHRDPSQATLVSFPRQITSRAYLRDRDLLRQRDESDFFLFDEEEEDEEHEAAAAEPDDEEAVEPDHDAEQFLEESGATLEEDESSL